MDKAQWLRLAAATFAWWKQGLLLALPATLRERWFPEPDSIVVRGTADGLVFARSNKGAIGDAPVVLPLDARQLPPDLAAWLSGSSRTRFLLDIPASRVLSRTLCFPLAVESDLRSMLELDMDRLTPFSPEMVYFDAPVISRDPESQKLQCRLMVIKRNDVQPALETLRRVGCPAAAIQISPSFEVPGNLLPDDERPRLDDKIRQRTVLALGIGFGALLLALYAPLQRHDGLLRSWQERVAEQKAAAKVAQTLLAQQTALEQRARFVAERREGDVPMVTVLDELAQRLPDGAWVNRFMAQGNDIQIFGEAESATALVPLLESSDLFEEVDFRSPTTRNDVSGRDRFHIGMKTVAPQVKP